MERVKTGIQGFDSLVEGGIPKGANLLLVGSPGTGKTIFGLQYLYTGTQNDERGLYITLDSRAEEIRDQGMQFGWDIKKLEDEKKIIFLEIPLNRQSRINIFKLIEDTIKKEGITRVVFDSLSSFIFNINQFILDLPTLDDLSGMSEGDKEYMGEDKLRKQYIPDDVLEKEKPDPKFYKSDNNKRNVYLMLREFSKIGTTNLLITSESYSGGELTVDGVSEYASDGVIKLELVDVGGGPSRLLKILKMRRTKNALEYHNFDITPKGITVT